MDWIIENVEWIFSGIGISIPLAILGWFIVNKRNLVKQKQSSGENSFNIQFGNIDND